MGRPRKYKSRADYYTNSDVMLEQTAFSLEPDEYGKIIYNGRFVTHDDSYYVFTKCNILNNTDKQDKNCFLQRKPDKVYKQISRMF